MDKRRNWLWITISTIWVGGILWVLVYKLCQDYFLIGLQGSIVIAVGLLLVWKLIFLLLGYMLRTETVNQIKILIMSFLCGIAFAVYLPLGFELINPTVPNQTNKAEPPTEIKTVPQIIPNLPIAPPAPQPEPIITQTLPASPTVKNTTENVTPSTSPPAKPLVQPKVEETSKPSEPKPLEPSASMEKPADNP